MESTKILRASLLPILNVIFLLSKAEVIWSLENYNGWNMPFAKTLEVYGTDIRSATFPISNYLVSVDPSAYYTVIFVQADIKPANT